MVATQDQAKLLFHVAMIASAITSYAHKRDTHPQGKLEPAIVSLPMLYEPQELKSLVECTLDVLASQAHLESHLDGIGILLGGCESCKVFHLAFHDPSLTQDAVRRFIGSVHVHEKLVAHLEKSLSSDLPAPADEA